MPDCRECGQRIIKNQWYPNGREDYCRHCYSLLTYGKSDVDKCFQGSVILLDD